jgi:hypothetical protein
MVCHTHAHTANEGNGCVVNDNVPVHKEVMERSKEVSETMHAPNKVLSPIVHVRLSEIFSDHVTTKVSTFRHVLVLKFQLHTFFAYMT